MAKQDADLVIVNASQLLTCASVHAKRGKELSDVGIIENGAVLISKGRISAVDTTDKILSSMDRNSKARIIDAKGKIVMPGFVDCHTHLVFAGSRESEFEQKVSGMKYDEILKSGGGIYSTVEATQKASKSDLVKLGMKRLDSMLAHGTTSVDIKSGYGLYPDDELKILEVIAELKRRHQMTILSTFLAHVVPKEFDDKEKRAEYIGTICRIIDEAVGKKLIDFCDVFCDKNAFSNEETLLILEHAKKRGLKLKIHAEQFSNTESAEMAAKIGAVSADHLDYISPKGIDSLKKSRTVGVLLPGVNFHLMLDRYPPAREMIDNGMAVALSTDFNPGSCPCPNMQEILGIACRQLRMNPAEAVNCATINAAFALAMEKDVGSIEINKSADIIIFDCKNYKELPYWFGRNLITSVIKSGKVVYTTPD